VNVAVRTDGTRHPTVRLNCLLYFAGVMPDISLNSRPRDQDSWGGHCTHLACDIVADLERSVGHAADLCQP
jgi:hypothetical protein